MRPAGARASNPPTVQTGLWADLGPRSATPPPKATPKKKPETLAEENARLRARVAELEAVAAMAGPARRCEAAQLDLSSASEPVRQRLEQQRTTILRLEALVERQAKALDATDADGAATEELLDRLARALRGVADRGPRSAQRPVCTVGGLLARAPAGRIVFCCSMCGVSLTSRRAACQQALRARRWDAVLSLARRRSGNDALPQH